MQDMKLPRRALLGGAALLAAGRARAALPSAPVAVNVVDVAGNLALTQKAFEAYAKAKPNVVSRFTFTKAPAPELPGKIKAQQDAGRVDIDLVLTGTDALSAGIEQKLWVENAPALVPGVKLDDILLPGAKKMQGLSSGQGVIVSYCPGGPLLEYMPDKVKTPPKTAADLLAWTKANPNKFIYARPANSGPGRCFMMGIPYLLGDSNPKDPVNGWAKTWDYLKALGENIEYYPTGTGPVFKELGEGTRDMAVTMTGWDINPRALGVVPKEAAVAPLAGFHFVTDAHFMCVPKGLSADKMAVLSDLMAYMLTKPAQAYTYDDGYFYPGPAVAGVTLDMAPAASQAVVKEYGRPEYEKLIAETPAELPLDPAQMVVAFRMWDERIGTKKTK